MNNHNHIIQRQTIEVKLTSGNDVAAIHDKVRNIYYEKIVPKAEALFSGLMGNEAILRINNLQLDIGKLGIDRLEEQFMERVILAIRESIEKKLQFDITDNDTELVQLHRSFADSFLYFLEFGYLPWWCTTQDLVVLEKAILSQPSGNGTIKNRLVLLLADRPSLTERLVFQFSDQFLVFLAQLYFPSFAANDLLQEVISFFPGVVSTDTRQLRDVFWKTIVRNFARSTTGIETSVIREVVSIVCKKENVSRNALSDAINKPGKFEFPLLHPFLTDPNNVDGEHKKDKLSLADTKNEKRDSDGSAEEKKTGIADQANEKIIDESEKDKGENKRELPDMSKDPVNKNEINLLPNEKDAGKKENDSPIDEKNPKKHTSKQPGETVIYTELSGLVILHPFLSTFFETLRLTEQKRFVNDEALYKAVSLLGYIATGETEIQEQRLLIPKLLCGMDLSMPLQRPAEITNEEKKEADELLATLIRYWTAVKNTSADGCRNSFLQREGKLSQKDNSWQLDVEHKTWDVLLSKLPWGFSIIKFPWMRQLLFVNWG